MSSRKQKSLVKEKVGKRVKLWPIAILAFVTFFYYANSISNGYALDDDLVTTTDNSRHKRVEKGVKAIPEIFRTHYVENDKQSYDYRPVVTSSFALEYSFFGDKTPEERATISHFISVLLYLIIGILIYLLIFKLYPDINWVTPFVVAVLFLIHPIHSEVVDNIKSRDELFVMIFGLLGMFSFLKFVDSDYKDFKYIVYGVIAIILGILSKKVGATFIVLIPLVLFYFRDVKIKKILAAIGVILVLMVLASIWKKNAMENTVLRETMFFENPLYFAESSLERIPMFFYSIMFYVKMMVFPFPLVYYYGYDQIEIVGWENPIVWIGVVFVIGGVVIALSRLQKKETWAFGFLFFMFGVGGAANLLFPAVGIVAERFVFTASLGVMIPLAYYGVLFFERHASKKPIFYAVSGVLVLVTFNQVNTRNKDWKSRFTLYKNDIEKLQKSAKAHSLLAVEYNQQAEIELYKNNNVQVYMAYTDSAIAEFQQALEVYEDYFNCSNNAGALYFSKKFDHYKARKFFYQAINSRPEYVEALANLGGCSERDLQAIDLLVPIVNAIPLDSTFHREEDIELLALDSELMRGAYSLQRIRETLQNLFKGVNINTSNWQSNYVGNLKKEINKILVVENGIFKRSLDDVFYSRLLGLLNNVNTSNANEEFKKAVDFINQYFANILNKELIDRGFNHKSKIQSVYETRKLVVDSMEYYFNKSIEYNPSYINSYKKLTAFYAKEKRYDDVIELNNKAIQSGGFEDKTEFYLNISNGYYGKRVTDTAIEYMIKGVEEIDRIYAVVYGNEELDAQRKNQKLLELNNRKKQMFGFLAQLYYSIGDEETYQRYTTLSAK